MGALEEDDDHNPYDDMGESIALHLRKPSCTLSASLTAGAASMLGDDNGRSQYTFQDGPEEDER